MKKNGSDIHATGAGQKKLSGYDWMRAVCLDPKLADEAPVEMLGDSTSEVWKGCNLEWFDRAWNYFEDQFPQFAKYRKVSTTYVPPPPDGEIEIGFAAPDGWAFVFGLHNGKSIIKPIEKPDVYEDIISIEADLLDLDEIEESGPSVYNDLSVDDWLHMLKDMPYMADLCECWHEFNELDIRELLCVRPELADKCPLGLLPPSFWVDILVKQPQLSEKCGWKNWEGRDWATLLRHQPQFADKCDWETLVAHDWQDLLIARPEFADKCDWSKLDSHNWIRLLVKHPQFADKCDFGKFDGIDFAYLIGLRPEFAEILDRRMGKDGDPLNGIWQLCMNESDWSLLSSLAPEVVRKYHREHKEVDCRIHKTK